MAATFRRMRKDNSIKDNQKPPIRADNQGRRQAGQVAIAHLRARQSVLKTYFAEYLESEANPV